MKNKLFPRVVTAAYAMANEGDGAELTLYGTIYSERPRGWDGEPLEGQFILLDEFLEDLSKLEDAKSLTVRMNSYGGDAGVSLTIHNRLRELSRTGTKLTCQVDGVAMSGGSLIMCACDTVRANPGSLIMIHKAWGYLFGAYNADELRHAAEESDAWDRMQAEIYQRKTGLPLTLIDRMMAETTYMTGREAKEKGFVDELLDAEPVQIAASADGRCLFVGRQELHLVPGLLAPDTIPTVTAEAAASVLTYTKPEVTGEEKGGNSMTMEEIRDKYPEELKQAEAAAAADAVRAERERLAEIDGIARMLDPALVREAKYGEASCTAAELALRAARQAAETGRRWLADLRQDAAESGTTSVGTAPIQAAAPEDEETDEAREVAAVKAMFHTKEG